jgi:hypothetical protein
MTQENKELLLRDLCTRIPYGVKILIPSWDERKMEYVDRVDTLYSVNGDNYVIATNDYYDFCVEDVKPYLFPLSSMTAEQLFEVQEILGKNEIEIEDGFLHIVDSDRNTITYLEILALLEWFYKNHFDIYGLIPMGLAIDATGLNIY